MKITKTGATYSITDMTAAELDSLDHALTIAANQIDADEIRFSHTSLSIDKKARDTRKLYSEVSGQLDDMNFHTDE